MLKFVTQYCSIIVFVQDCVKSLIKHQADVNARDKNWQTPLHLAASNNHVKCAGKKYLRSCLQCSALHVMALGYF